MEIVEREEKIPSTPSLEELDFNAILEGKLDATGIIFEGVILEEGAEINLSILRNESRGPNNKLEVETFSFSFVSGNSSVEAHFLVEYKWSPPVIKDGIGRDGPKNKKSDLPKEIGMRIYRKMVDLYQSIASKRNTPLNHKLSRQTEVYGKELSRRKWMKKFGPIIEEMGYESLGDKRTWRKIYNPLPENEGVSPKETEKDN